MILQATNPKHSYEKRKKLTYDVAQRSGAALAGRALVKIDPWAEVLALGMAGATFVALSVAEYLTTPREPQPQQPQAQPGPAPAKIETPAGA